MNIKACLLALLFLGGLEGLFTSAYAKAKNDKLLTVGIAPLSSLLTAALSNMK